MMESPVPERPEALAEPEVFTSTGAFLIVPALAALAFIVLTGLIILLSK
jgi:hypothetical protein